MSNCQSLPRRVSVAAVWVTLLSCAPASEPHHVTFTGRLVTAEGHPWKVGGAWLRPRWGDSTAANPGGVFVDSTGRFHLPAILTTGCYGIVTTAWDTEAFDWRVWVDRSGRFDLGEIRVDPTGVFTGEGPSHVVLGCGARDTLTPEGGWTFDTVRVEDP